MANNSALQGTDKPPVVAILGPTAAGKTAAALAVARAMPVEIISVDSALVYRDMDIGTAKPTLAERAVAPHHLIDILDPSQAYSAMQFCDDALQVITQIQARGKLPLLVGGTMLYYKALRDGLDTLPAADASIRAALDAQAAQIGIPGMHALLMQIDPITAARLPPNDSQRIQRALEIYQLTGQPMSALLTQAAPAPLPFSMITIALEPSDRSALHQRIALRFDAMLDASQPNLLDEVAALRARGDLHPMLPSMRCVGYRQAWEYLDAQYDRATLRDKVHAATRQLAKRQLTWLRSMPERRVIDCLARDASQQVVVEIERSLGSRAAH